MFYAQTPLLTQPELPQEVVDLIIDEVSRLTSDENWLPVDLRSCLLVSTSFCSRARSHLFRNVKFRSRDTTSLRRELVCFLDLLQSSRGRDAFAALGGPIAPLVKSFHLPFAECSNSEEILSLFNSFTFISVLRYLSGEAYGPSMIRFDIQSIPHRSQLNRMDWERLSTPSQDALYALFQSSYLEAIHLHGFENLPSNFLDGSQIKHLEISNAHCSTSRSTVNLTGISNQLQLESISTDQTVPIDLLTFNGMSITSKLEELDICSFPALILDGNTWDLIDATSGSLRRLRVKFMDHLVVINKHLKFPDLIALEELTIYIKRPEVFYRPPHSSCDNDIIELCILLCDPSSRCPLHTVNISIAMIDVFPDPNFFDPHLKSHWVLLDRALSNTNFVSLRKVSLCLDFRIHCRSNFPFKESLFKDNVKASLKRVFPVISESSSIEFVVEIKAVAVYI